MNISEMDLKELKALAYDEGMKIEIARQNLMLLNQEIQKRIKEQDEKPLPDQAGS